MSIKNWLLVAAVIITGCSSEPNRLPDITAPGAPEQGSTIAAAAEHGARAAVSGIESGTGFLVALVALLGLPFLIMMVLPWFELRKAEKIVEGALIAAAGIAGAILTWSTGLGPWFLVWIPLAIVCAFIKGAGKWLIFIIFDAIVGIVMLARLVDWGLALPFHTKLIVLGIAAVLLVLSGIGRATSNA